MWIIFENGTFYSAVKNTFDGRGGRNVRSRDRRSAEILADWATACRGEVVEVIETMKSDYQFRVILTDDEWAAYVLEMVKDSKATNFKAEVGKNLGHKQGKAFIDALHDTWQIWWEYQHRGGKAKTRFQFEGSYYEPAYRDVLSDEDWEDSVEDEGWMSYQVWEAGQRAGKAARKGKKLGF